MSIIVTNLTKIYGNQKAVDDISFTASDNEIVGFLGPNGAGKSTTMKMITGYLSPDAGNVLVNNIDIKKDPLQAKKEIGYLPEGNPLYYEMYVREYLEFIAGTHQVKNAKGKIEEVIQITGLKPESNKKAGQLSKGYKQRLGLAAALIHDPKVLILDEPTSGLDPNQIVEIREVIKILGKSKTIIFSSHILQEVESICDRVIIINKGTIVADKTLADLQSSSKTGHIVIVEFGKTVNVDELKSLKGVEDLVQKNNQYHFQTDNPDQLKKTLLEFSLQNDLDIISLQTKGNNLEDVFRNLTTDQPI
jgi:ABC-2 type transport system ATP-binding protein